MNNINKYISQDIDFSKLLFELEQINLRLLVELKQQQKVKTRNTKLDSEMQNIDKRRKTSL